jgi:hypothetical protein
MRAARLLLLLLLPPAVLMPASTAAMGERPKVPPAAEATVPSDVQRITPQVDGMT